MSMYDRHPIFTSYKAVIGLQWYKSDIITQKTKVNCIMFVNEKFGA